MGIRLTSSNAGRNVVWQNASHEVHSHIYNELHPLHSLHMQNACVSVTKCRSCKLPRKSLGPQTTGYSVQIAKPVVVDTLQKQTPANWWQLRSVLNYMSYYTRDLGIENTSETSTLCDTSSPLKGHIPRSDCTWVSCCQELSQSTEDTEEIVHVAYQQRRHGG